MATHIRNWLFLSISCSLIGSVTPAAGADPESVDYLRDIKPVFKARCYACHGALKQESGFRLDTARAAEAGGDSGPAIVAGQPQQSLLWQRVNAPAGERMPPEGEPLSDTEREKLRRWILAGAPAAESEQPEIPPDQHWAFQPIRRPPLPPARFGETSPIDRFLAQQQSQQGVPPLPRAAAQLLLRRLYLDLKGLPPSREELLSFRADPSPVAYSRTVDKLLSSPEYGERWGRHWMDVWRYSDWYGRRQVGDVRNSYPHIWRWRDWIISSLNEDKGYDQMIREMLAADELHPEDDSRIAALGFIVRNWFSLNYDTWKQDLVEHTGKAFLGLRLNCAHCHDHKYDPISQEEYFRFRAFFEPLEFRHDRVPGGPKLAKYQRYKPGSGASLKPIAAGLPRVYDLYHDEPTQMYRLGDTRDRLDRPPVAPGGPRVLGGDALQIEPVHLPPLARYPALKPFARESEIASRRESQAQAQQAADRARTAVEEARQTLAKAEQALEAAKEADNDATPEEPSAIPPLLGLWRFEGESEGAFLSDASPHGLQLARVNGGAAPASPFALQPAGTRKAFRLNKTGYSNRFAAQFQQTNSFAYLETAPSPHLSTNQLSIGAFVHFDVSQRNFNRTIAEYTGCWSLLHRGLDETSFELRVRYWSDSGELRDVATGTEQSPSGNAPLRLKTGHDYYVCFSLDKDRGRLFAWELGSDGMLQVFEFPRSPTGQDFSKLAKPAPAATLKIGNSDGTGRVVGLLDEVRYAAGAVTTPQLAEMLGVSADEATRLAVTQLNRAHRQLQLAELRKQDADSAWEAAKRNLESFESRIAADLAKAEGMADDLATKAKVAAQQESAYKLAAAAARLVRADRLLFEAQHAVPADDKKVTAARQEKMLADQAQKKLFSTEEQQDSASVSYSPVGPEYPATSTGRRKALALWITDRSNPLTARVAVNHIWLRHFGRPLVQSVFDLGRGGKSPSHPKLLDWLAAELVEHDWSMKHLHRLIVHSAAYQRSSRPQQVPHPNQTADPDNRLWWKFDRQRMDAEIVRDSLLYLARRLDLRKGGPEIASTDETSSDRRSLYFAIYPEAGGAMRFLSLFDAPDPTDCYQRSQSIVPQQALAMSNSELALEQATHLATVIAEQATSGQDGEYIEVAFELILSRPPSENETRLCAEFMKRQRTSYETSNGTTNSADHVHRVHSSLIRSLLMHNDFIMIH